MEFACLWLFGAIFGYALEGTIEAALIAGAIAFYGYALLLAAMVGLALAVDWTTRRIKGGDHD